MKKVIIYSVFIVGMHHHGSRQLDVGSGFIVRHEPENQYDSNALSVASDGQLMAYIKKEQALILSEFFKKNLNK